MKRLFSSIASTMGIVLAFSLTYAAAGSSQREREIPSPQDNDFGAKYFDELRRIFGRFKDADLKRVFQSAGPIRCADLVTDKGEWREVAFFNEDRKLGDWYRTSIDEVKNDLAVYVFKGNCGGQRSALEVTTKFPVEESLKAFDDGRIHFKDINVNVNAPVPATFDSRTQAYTFDLPYLFRVSGKDGNFIYSLYPRSASDTYARDALNRWQCKAVAADDVTYQFLICRADLIPRGPASRGGRDDSFGSSAFSILSDGKEASSSVKLSFGDSADSRSVPAEKPPEEPPVARRTWQPASSSAKLSEVGQREFRLSFNPQVWTAKIGQAQWIAGGNVTSGSSPAPRSGDYCAWRPRSAGEAVQLLDPSKGESNIYSIGFTRELQSTSATVEIQGESGSAVGVLQCFFQRIQTPSDVTVAMWRSAVGQAVVLEVPGQ
jgi:hypothetical protein